jgi:hypothetical protein
MGYADPCKMFSRFGLPSLDAISPNAQGYVLSSLRDYVLVGNDKP